MGRIQHLRAPRRSSGIDAAAARKLLIGFGVGGLLILCTWAARALLDSSAGTGQAEAAPPAATAEERPTPGEANTATPGGDAGSRPFEQLAKSASQKGLVGGDVASPVDVLVSLGVVIAVMVGVLFGVSRLMRRARLAPGRHRELELKDALSLGGKRQVYVVSYKDRTLVLGCGHEDISLLAEYAADEFSESSEDAEQDEAASPVAAPVTATTEAIEAPVEVASEIETSDVAPNPKSPRRPRKAATADAGGVVLELSAAARQQASAPDTPEATTTATRPSGIDRVPAAFRHLLDESLVEHEESRG